MKLAIRGGTSIQRLARSSLPGCSRRRLPPVRACQAPISMSTSVDHAPDFTDITRTTYRQVLPHIKTALQDCTFYAFDCEMTGLTLEHHRDEFLDEPQDRWNRMRESSASYVITQFGLSCFKLMTDGSYQATTFNAMIYPEPISADVVGWLPARRFLADASSLAFLSSHDFDFNKWIQAGVPYLPARLHDEKLQQLARTQQQSEAPSGREVVVTKVEDQQLVARLVDQVVAWLGGDAVELDLDWLNNSFKRLLGYQELARPRAWHEDGAPLTGPTESDPGFYVTKVEVDGWPRLRLVRGSRAAAAEHEAAQRAARTALLVEAGGFADVIRAMRDSRKPGVGHNCFYDVAYVLANFAHGTALPPLWSDLKSLVSSWFPGGLYDTKHLARNLPESVFPAGTALGDVYKALTQEGAARVAAQGLLGEASLPTITHAPGSVKYAGIPAGGAAHEAGYDAYMTGAVFACLERLVAASQPSPSLEVQPTSLDHLTQYNGRLNIARSDMPFLSLLGPDAPLVRPHVLHVSLKGVFVRVPELLTVLAAAGLPGRPRITICPAQVGGFLLELEMHVCEQGWNADRLAGALEGKAPSQPGTPWVVTSWEQFQVTKQQLMQEAAEASGPGSKRRRVEPPPPATPAPSLQPTAAPATPTRCVIS